MSRTRILIIDNSLDYTGALANVLRTSASLAGQFEFIFVLPQGTRADYAVEEKGFRLYHVRMLELSRRWQSLLFYVPVLFRSFFSVRKIIRKENIGLVHVNDFYNLIMPLGHLLGNRTNYICFVNFVPDRFPALLRKFWIGSHLTFARRFISVSQHVQRQLPRHKKIVTIPDTLPLTVREQSSSTARLNTILYLGNYIEGKGQEYALQAFAPLAASFPEWTLKMVGGDMGIDKNKRFLERLREITSNLGIERQVSWNGFSKAPHEEYQRASIALNFSRSESFSLTVQEALYYGCPVIATRSGGPAEIIDDDVTGILVSVDDLPAMTASIRRLVTQPELRAKMSVAAYTDIRKKFSAENTTGKLAAVYREVLQS